MAKRKSNGSYVPEIVIADGSKGNLWEGLVTAVDDPRSIRKGQTPDEINWVTSQKGDNIQLRGGKLLVGRTRRTGDGVTGIGVGTLANGIQQIVYSANQSVYYYDNSVDTHETTTADLLGPAANGETTSIFPYTNPAGSWLFITSPHSSIYKVAAANPRSATDQNQKSAIPNYRFGFAKIDQGVFMGVNRFGVDPSKRDPSGLYFGRVDTVGGSSGYPMFMPVPLQPSGVAQTGGLMTSGTYYYVITAVNANGTETTQSAQSSGVVVDGSTNKSVQLSWKTVAGASYYNVYRTTSSASYPSPSLAGSTQYVSNPLIGSFTDNIGTTLAGSPPSSSTISPTTSIGTGNGSTTTFSGVLSYYYSSTSTPRAPITGFGVQITDGNESFNDDKSGNLVGSLGGSGTIDYMTGAYSVTFQTAPSNGSAITYSGYSEDATQGGVLDFTVDGSDETGTYAQIFRQDDAGGIGMGIAAFQGIQYVLHQFRTWNTQISVGGDGDRTYSNDPYWSKIGAPFPRSFFETGDGVLFIDNTDAENPKVSILEIPPNSTNLTVVPISISDDLDLSMFNFSKAVVYRFGEYDFMSCIESVNGIPNTYNSRTYIRNIYSSNWNLTDFTPNCLGIYQGQLIMGDSLSPNLFQIFSGFDDDGGVINNYWDTSYYDCGLEGLKQIDYIHVSGLIQPNQSIQISLSLDFGNYVQYFTVAGNGSYVNKSIQVEIGGTQIGSSVIGSGAGGGTVANPFEIDIPVFTDNFEYISTQFKALNIGYAEVDKLSYKGVRNVQRSILPTQSVGQ